MIPPTSPRAIGSGSHFKSPAIITFDRRLLHGKKPVKEKHVPL
jgi:hypothetical protein